MRDQKELPEKWSWVRIGDVLTFTGGGTPSKADKSYWNGNVYWASVKDVKGNFLTDTEDKISKKGLENSSAATAYPGEVILISRISPGKVIITNIETAINQDLKIIRPKSKYLPKFLVYYFASIEQIIINLSSGTTVKGITLNNLNEIKIPVLSPEQQQTLVLKLDELFSELDKGIENLKLAQQQLKIYRQSVLKWAFDGSLTSVSSIGSVPLGWRKVLLGEVCISVEYGSATKSSEKGKVPVLRMGNIQNGKFNWDDLVYTSDEEEINKYLLKKDDVLFNRTNSAELVGKTAIFKENIKAIFAGYLIRINRIEKLLNADFLNYFLNSLQAKIFGNTVRTFGVNQSNINGTKLKSYPILLPPINEQIEIVKLIENRFSEIDKLEEELETNLKRASNLKQSILKKAFECKLN